MKSLVFESFDKVIQSFQVQLKSRFSFAIEKEILINYLRANHLLLFVCANA